MSNAGTFGANSTAWGTNGVTSGAVHWLAEAGMIFLTPLIVVGLWRERRARVFHAALWYALCLFAAMTLIFTFAGDRGGLFHSTGALLPFFYAAAPIGLDGAIGLLPVAVRGLNRLAVLPQTGRLRWYLTSVALGAALLLGFVVINLL